MPEPTTGIILPDVDEEGKTRTLIVPSTKGWKLWFTGKADDLGPPLVRGGGTPLALSFTAGEVPATKYVDFQFGEPVELHDGQACWEPLDAWGVKDRLCIKSVIPASTATVNGTTTGNCDKTDLGGGANIITPAAGDGGYDITLTTGDPAVFSTDAVPVPAEGYGFWDVDSSTGIVTPSATPGTANWNLYDFPNLAQFVNKVPMNKLGILDIDTYSIEWVHPTWVLRFSVEKNTAGDGDVAIWVLAFRENVSE